MPVLETVGSVLVCAAMSSAANNIASTYSSQTVATFTSEFDESYWGTATEWKDIADAAPSADQLKSLARYLKESGKATM